MGLTFIEDKPNYVWYGKFMNDYPLPEGVNKEDLGKCNHVIQVPDSHYEIGVVKDKDKEEYNLIYDFWRGQQIEKVCGGRTLGKLKAKYTITELQLKLKAKKAKYREEQKEKDGQKIKRFIINT